MPHDLLRRVAESVAARLETGELVDLDQVLLVELEHGQEVDDDLDAVDQLRRERPEADAAAFGQVERQLVHRVANRDADPAHRFEEVEALLQESPPAAPTPLAPPSPQMPARRQAAQLSENEVIEALRAHQFRPAAAADALGIPRSSIYDLMNKIPSLRKASELTSEDIEAARRRVGPSLEAMAEDLEVSKRALLRRLGQLES